MRPRERISIGFKSLLDGCNKYVLFVIDEFIRYPFAFPCRDITTATVISHLTTLICMFGFPSYVHSDRGSSFMSKELKEYLTTRGIATSRSTPYHPTDNSQCERINQTVWKNVKLFLRNYELPQKAWESVLPEALHSVRCLLCTKTNSTPYERFLGFDRRSMIGKALPSWLVQPGPVLLCRFVRKERSLCG